MRRKLFSAILVSALLGGTNAHAGGGWKKLLGWGSGEEGHEKGAGRERIVPVTKHEPEHHAPTPPVVSPALKKAEDHGGGDHRPATIVVAHPTPPPVVIPTIVTPTASHTETRREEPIRREEPRREEPRREEWRPPPPPPKPALKVVRRTSDFELDKHPIRIAVMGRSETWGVPDDVPSRTRKFARAAAQAGIPIVTGGGRGLPKEAERAAYEQGGETWAVPPTSSASEFEYAHGGRTTSVVFPTGTGGGDGSIEREAPLAQISNIRAYTNGGPGTFGELIAGLHSPGVLAFLAGSGGVAGNAVQKILPFIGVPKDVKIVEEHDPNALFDRSKRALLDLERSGVSTRPKSLYQPNNHRAATSYDDRKGKNVVSILADDGGMMSAGDQAKAMELMDLVMTQELNGKKPLPIMARSQAGEAIAFRALNQHGVDSVVVTGSSGNDLVLKPKSGGGSARLKVINTGKGDGVGQFGLHREVVEHADVIFVTSSFFRNLSGLAFAMRGSSSPVVAVLELDSSGTRHLDDILKTVDRKFAEKVIYDRDPKRLMEKVNDKLKSKSSWKSSSDDRPWSWGGFGSSSSSGSSKPDRDKDLPSWLRDKPEKSEKRDRGSRYDIELD